MTAIIIAVSPTVVQARGLVAPVEDKITFISMPLPKVVNKPYYGLKPTTNGFVKGNCTHWVAIRREGMNKPVTWRGNAGEWFENAKKQGYNVGSKPEVGAIYVTRAENSRGTRSGHVALVIDVKPSGIVVEEMNYKGFNKVSTRWVTNEKLSKDRVGFVY